MRIAPLILAVGFAGLQNLSWIDCCCGSLCQRPNESCEDCAHEESAAKEKDCCSGTSGTEIPKESGQEACLHIAPQTEVETPAVTPLPAAPTFAEASPSLEFGNEHPAPAPRIETSPPRLRSHLLLEVLLN